MNRLMKYAMGSVIIGALSSFTAVGYYGRAEAQRYMVTEEEMGDRISTTKKMAYAGIGLSVLGMGLAISGANLRRRRVREANNLGLPEGDERKHYINTGRLSNMVGGIEHRPINMK